MGETSTNSIASIFAWSQGLLARARFDDNDALRNFATTLEKVIIKTVERGAMTKDLAILVEGTTSVPRNKYLNTFEFIDKVAENLKLALRPKKKIIAEYIWIDGSL